MIHIAFELLSKLRLLTLVGQNSDKELEWIGTDKAWKILDYEEESILRDWDLKKEYVEVPDWFPLNQNI